MQLITGIFDFLDDTWENRISSRVISSILITSFSLGLAFVFVYNSTSLGEKQVFGKINYFLAIDLTFQVLLIAEIFGLIFVLPKSVADSVGKQFEILSIILLRSAFKEFGEFEQPIIWEPEVYTPILHMLSDAFGALVIFLIIGFYYKKQRHERITGTDVEQKNFIIFKKIIALLLMITFVVLCISDLAELFQKEKYEASFNTFYTILIFSDVLILLYSLRYSTRYYNLFRYSSFALATILIRISLTAPPYINVSLGVVAGLFVLGLTITYNYFTASDDF
ncbi:MAG: hypothetical protein AAF363_09655 [Bacteroidota bacterium]